MCLKVPQLVKGQQLFELLLLYHAAPLFIVRKLSNNKSKTIPHLQIPTPTPTLTSCASAGLIGRLWAGPKGLGNVLRQAQPL